MIVVVVIVEGFKTIRQAWVMIIIEVVISHVIVVVMHILVRAVQVGPRELLQNCFDLEGMIKQTLFNVNFSIHHINLP